MDIVEKFDKKSKQFDNFRITRAQIYKLEYKVL